MANVSTKQRKPHAPSHHPFWWPDKRVKAMHAMYRQGATFRAVALKFGVANIGSVRQAFVTRGLPLLKRPNPGQFQARRLKTAAEVTAILRRQTKLAVPSDLHHDWRHWSMARRGAFLCRLRAQLNDPREAPRLRYSANVEPFDYTTPAARAIADELNRGRSSLNAQTKINLRSQGVIYQGKLWFWTVGYGYIYRLPGPYLDPHCRLVLHRYLWEQAHGPLGPTDVVRFADGNPNNLTVANLFVQDKNLVCRQNQAKALQKKSDAHTAALLRRTKQQPSNPTHA